jgi:ComF family protein
MPWQGGGTCRGCQRKPLPFARAFSALAYGGSLSQSLLRFKHGGNRHIARPLGAYLAPLLSQAVESGAVIACPVPLHPRRLRQRGFNQALELLRAARALAPHSTRIAMDCDVLARTVDTPSLGHGSPAHRQQVVANAFSVVRPRTIAGRCVLVVDDVMTTGATLAECARTLLRSGASQVLVAALARAV